MTIFLKSRWLKYSVVFFIQNFTECFHVRNLQEGENYCILQQLITLFSYHQVETKHQE